MRRLAPLAVAMLLLAAAPAPAVAADELVAPVGTRIDATGSHLAYSQPDGARFRLVIDGRLAPVAPASTPFDVDLGTDARGALAAVYTRLRARDDRDVVSLDVASGVERRVAGASRRGRDELAPSVSRGRVAFAIERRWRDRLASVALRGSGRLTELRAPGGPARDFFAVEQTELAGGVLAFTATEQDAEEDDADSSYSQLWFARAGRKPRLLFRARNTGMRSTDLVGLAVSAGWVSTGLAPFDESSDDPSAVRVSPSRGTLQRALLPDVPVVRDYAAQRELVGYAATARVTYTSACGNAEADPACRLLRTALQWRTDRR